MTKIKKFAGTFVAAGALLVVAAPAAVAAPPVPFTITESIDNNAGAFSFTASSPLCPSGTFEDELLAAGGGEPTNKGNFLVRTVYTCDNNGDTFFAQKHAFAKFNADGSTTNTGPITLQGGTGAFTGLSGHGVDNGTANAAGIAVGEISGVLKLN